MASTKVFWQEEDVLTDGSIAYNVVLEDRATGASIVINCVDEEHADEVGTLLLKAGFNE